MPPNAADTVIEERVRWPGPAGTLCGVLAYPAAGRPARAVLLCAPHPHFAGDMDNNVIRHLARHLAADSLVLRFDYRGVGDSQLPLPPGHGVFDYWSDVEARRDYADATADARSALTQLQAWALPDTPPCHVIGYSFGVVTGLAAGRDAPGVTRLVALAPPLGRVDFSGLADLVPPSLWVLGRADFLYEDAALADLRRCIGPRARWSVRAQSDHFFRDEEAELAQVVARFLIPATPDSEESRHV